MNNLSRIVQIVWLVVAAVCSFEAYMVFSTGVEDKTSGWLFTIVGIFAIVRYVMLRRSQLKKENKID
ncbi:MAG: hypothetical protein KJP21_06275 [Bacteroidia bacterium]|nr:hypothetical protein [Bacteroidia bacterium]NNJ55471.1 hypothetical protein [Bacteroidia bacterium]